MAQFVDQARAYIGQLDSFNIANYDTLFLVNDTIIIANTVYRILQMLKGQGKINNIPFLYGILLMYCFGLGGNTLVSIMTGKAWYVLSVDIIVPLYFVVWTLISCTPFDLVHHITGFALFEPVLYAFDGFWVGNIVSYVIESTAVEYPGRLVAPVLIGTLAGSAGGGILFPIIMNGYIQKDEDKFFSTLISSPGLNVIIPFALSAFYFVSRHIYATKVVALHLAGHELSFSTDLVIRVGFAVHFFLIWTQTRLPYLFTRSAPKKVVKPVVVEAKKEESKKKK